ncbi:MAG: hypothetical protein KIH63_003135 [Candidatus Saccharibacteria bacterium]|nr:hypothetical protein [Candidatus Saccharibacteria bacterium]
MAQKKSKTRTAKKKSLKRGVTATAKVKNSSGIVSKPQAKKQQSEQGPPKRLSSGWRLFFQSLSFLKVHLRLFGGITLVYLVLNLVLGRGLTIINLNDVAYDIQTSSSVEITGLAMSVSLFGYLLTSSGATANGSSTYMTLLTILVSLVAVWTLRQIRADKKPTVKQAFYNSTSSLIPSVLVLVVIGLQMLPMIIGGWIYGAIVMSGRAVQLAEKIVWGGVSFGLTFLTLYLLSSSIFAFYIVNLPNVTPLQALRSARGLVRGRRFSVMRKLLFLPFLLFVMSVLLFIPLLSIVPGIAAWVYILLSSVALILVHVYVYSLYRELL